MLNDPNLCFGSIFFPIFIFAGRVASYKQLEGGVKFVDELPKTASGKILRRLLRDQARQEEVSKQSEVSKL